MPRGGPGGGVALVYGPGCVSGTDPSEGEVYCAPAACGGGWAGVEMDLAVGGGPTCEESGGRFCTLVGGGGRGRGEFRP